jgi:hypothetical protein
MIQPAKIPHELPAREQVEDHSESDTQPGNIRLPLTSIPPE